MRGQKLFFGKTRCGECHPAPDYTDHSMHNLQVERFYKEQTANGLVATAQGPIKTFTLRGIKESPPTSTTAVCSPWRIQSSSSTWCWT
jgi:cytochrome c peroxidase